MKFTDFTNTKITLRTYYTADDLTIDYKLPQDIAKYSVTCSKEAQSFIQFVDWAVAGAGDGLSQFYQW